MSRNVGLYRIGGRMELVGVPPVGVAATAYAFQFSGLNGSGAYTWAADSLPSGWTLVAGLLAHASPAAQSFYITITMTDTANRNNPPVLATYLVTIE
jgi:hypothetical protein